MEQIEKAKGHSQTSFGKLILGNEKSSPIFSN